MKNPTMKNIWAYALVAWFGLFISAILVFVVFAVKHPMALVSEDYYEQELAYQQRIDHTARARATPGIAVHYDPGAHRIRVQIPVNPALHIPTGQIRLYRPSNDRLDRTIPLSLSPDGSQQLDTSTLQPGLWKVQLQWQQDDNQFFHEQAVVTAAATPQP